MQCSGCQRDNDPAAKFCEGCGTRLARQCSACETELSADARFCKECGAPVGSVPSTPASPPAPEAYTPKHLAERILTSRAALEGERKQVTVLFADLKGSMELLADRDPEEARAILDPVLERMMDAVHRYEGTVNQVMGDGIMALFGAPLAHEDHAVRACYAALRMQETVKQYADEVRRAEGITPQIRVGLNSGEVVVRSIGSDLRMDYTAVGQTTNLAARMEQLATPGSILLAPATLHLAEGYVQVHTLGPMTVKGLSEPVEVHELQRAGIARSRLQATVARGLTKFVGRDAELETLRRTLDQAAAGHGQIVALVGEPGVGKSRLVWEFTHSHRTQGWLVLASGSVSYGKATSYLPVSDLLRTYLHIEAADDPRRIRQKVLGRVLDLDRALEPCLPALLSLLDVLTDDPAWEALDPSRRRQQTLDALKRWILRESQEQPVLLVVEDLHWIDSETQALLDSLVESLPTTRILLLVNYRPEYAHNWARKTYYQQLRLDPLLAESAEELLQALLGDDAGLDGLRRLLIERTEGNPFFLEETVRSLVETGVLTGERGAFHHSRATAGTQVPATVQAVLAARIDRLDPDDKRLLQCAAVIGKDVPYPLLQAIAEQPDAALRQGLARLQAAEFLYEASLFPDLEYTFKHALTHEVAYGGLLQERRRLLHRYVVDAIERSYPDRVEEHIEQLAHHALRGEHWEKAASYLHQAGMKAADRAAYEEAVTYFERALEVVPQVPETAAARQQTVDLHLAVSTALEPLAEVTRMFAHLREAEAIAEAMGDAGRLGRVALQMSNQLYLRGDYQQMIASSERTLALAAAADDPALEIGANYYLGMAYHRYGRFQDAEVYLRRTVVALGGERLHERLGQARVPAAAARSRLAWGLSERGEFLEAATWAEEAVQIAEAMDEPYSLAFGYFAVGFLSTTKGDFVQAISALERALVTCQTRQVPVFVSNIAAALVRAYIGSGRLIEGSCLLQHFPIPLVVGQRSVALAGRSEALMLLGAHEQATQLAEEALEWARNCQQKGEETHALRLLGDVTASAEPPEIEQAQCYYHQALALAEELSMRPLVAHCHLGLGTVYRKIGRDERAHAELATATDLYRGMEMTFWLERAEAELAQIASAP